MLKFEVLSDATHFDELAPEWESLLGRAASNSATVAPFWQKTWWKVFGSTEGRRLRVITLRDAGTLVGIAPLLARTHWYRPGIPMRRLELLASGEPQADEICSDYNGLVAEAGREQEVATAVVSALAGREIGGWDELVLPAMSSEDPVVEELAAALRASGHAVSLEPSSTSPYIQLPSTWEAYLALLTGGTRRLLKTTLRDLESWSGGDVSFERARTPEDIERGFGILMRLHGERWTSAEPGYSGVFTSDRFRQFHEAVMRKLAGQGGLELCWLNVRGEPIAALYNFVWDNKVYHYQSGRRVDLPKQIRAGIAIHSHAIRSAIEDGRREYDFLPGDGRYKEQLALGQRQLVELRATNRPMVEIARQVARRGLRGARAVSQGLRQMLDVPVEVW